MISQIKEFEGLTKEEKQQNTDIKTSAVESFIGFKLPECSY